MRINNILMIKDFTAADKWNNYTDRLAAAFRKMGILVDISDATQCQALDAKIYIDNYDLVFSFNGLTINENYSSNYRNRNQLCWSFYSSHPIFENNKLLNSNNYQIVSFTDPHYASYAKNIYYNNNMTCFLPCGVLFPETPDFDSRKYSVSIFCEYVNSDIYIKKLDSYSGKMHEIIENVYNRLYINPELSLETEFVNSLSSYGITLSQDEKRDSLAELSFMLPLIQSKKVELIVNALSDNGISVHVINANPSDYDELLEDVKDSELAICFSIEQSICTMSCKTICITENNSFLENSFSKDKDLFFFSIDKINDLILKIKDVLSSDDVKMEVSLSARNKLDSFFTWDKCAEKIINYSESIDVPVKKHYTNCADADFYNIVNFINSEDINLIYEKVKSQYVLTVQNYPSIQDFLITVWNSYPYWGTFNPPKGDFGVIWDRITELKNNLQKFIWMYESLRDNSSKLIFKNVLLNWITFNPKWLIETANHTLYKHYFDLDILNLNDHEVFVDLGAFTGDSATDFTEACENKYKRIYCYEFSERNIEKLKANLSMYNDIIIRNCAIGSTQGWAANANSISDTSSDRIISGASGSVPIVTIDEDISETITYIKADIEGSELDSLIGGKCHIIAEHPKLAFSIYHGNKDIWRIADYINSLDSTYRFYIRYYGRDVFADEIILYAI